MYISFIRTWWFLTGVNSSHSSVAIAEIFLAPQRTKFLSCFKETKKFFTKNFTYWLWLLSLFPYIAKDFVRPYKYVSIFDLVSNIHYCTCAMSNALTGSKTSHFFFFFLPSSCTFLLSRGTNFITSKTQLRNRYPESLCHPLHSTTRLPAYLESQEQRVCMASFSFAPGLQPRESSFFRGTRTTLPTTDKKARMRV